MERIGGDAYGRERNAALVKVIFLAHIAATLFMCGAIWFVQIVHYPLFEQVGTSPSNLGSLKLDSDNRLEHP